MLVDPVTVAAAAPTPELKLGIIRSDGYGTERQDGANGYRVITNHQRGKNSARHYVQMILERDATNPYTSLPQRVSASVSFTINVPSFGFTEAEIVALAKALTDYRDDSEVTTLRLIRFES